MFRKRFQANGMGGGLGGGGGGSLPTSMGSSTSSTGGNSSIFNLGSKGADGSARSIHVQAPILSRWNRTSRAVKNSYMVALISLVVVFLGYKLLTYYHAKIHMNCTSMSCTITIRAVGAKPIVVTDIPRQQILGARAVKVNVNGGVENDNVNLNEEWKYESPHKKKKNSGNNKGPDKNGHYLTYAFMLQNKDPNAKEEPMETPGDTDESIVDEKPPPPVDLSPILPFLVRYDSEDPHKYFLITRQHGIVQPQRRVRTMIQKTQSYANRRRHKLVVKEHTTPDWKSVLMLVLGGCSFLVSLLLALFWEDDDAHARQSAGGPGARRRHHNHHHHGNPQNRMGTSSNVSPYQRTIPSRYEVATTPRKGSHGTTMRRRN